MTDFSRNLGIRIRRGAPVVMRILITEKIPLLNLTGMNPPFQSVAGQYCSRVFPVVANYTRDNVWKAPRT